jgi:hypothetical protein
MVHGVRPGQDGPWEDPGLDPAGAPMPRSPSWWRPLVTESSSLPADVFEPIADVPIQMVNTYVRLWQLETWLRSMVYVELRALLGDTWAQGLEPNSKSFQADKSLTHMPTPEMSALSYAQNCSASSMQIGTVLPGIFLHSLSGRASWKKSRKSATAQPTSASAIPTIWRV